MSDIALHQADNSNSTVLFIRFKKNCLFHIPALPQPFRIWKLASKKHEPLHRTHFAMKEVNFPKFYLNFNCNKLYKYQNYFVCNVVLIKLINVCHITWRFRGLIFHAFLFNIKYLHVCFILYRYLFIYPASLNFLLGLKSCAKYLSKQ